MYLQIIILILSIVWIGNADAFTLSNASVSSYTDVTGIWTQPCTGYLKSDGTCDTPASGGSVTNLCKTIPNPNDADAWLFHINQKGSAWTASEIRGVAIGGTSVVFTMQECDANGANCAAIEDAQTVTTGTASTGTITDASVADNAVLKLDIGTVTGAVTQLMVCVEVQ